MNPTKGKGERYIYCQHEAEGDCLAVVAHKGWSAFNCEACEVYLRSEIYRERKMDSPDNPENDEFNEHISDGGQGMEGKKLCKKCGEEKAISEFTAKESAPDGLDYSCKECKRKYQNELNAKKRNGTYVPYTREKGKEDRIQKLKESAERVKKVRRQKSEGRSQNEDLTIKTRKKAVFADGNREVFGAVTVIAEPGEAITMQDVQMAENRGDYRRMAVAFINLVEKKFLQETFDVLFAQSAEGKGPGVETKGE